MARSKKNKFNGIFCNYKATNLIDGKMYIGKTDDLERRKDEHLNSSFNENSDGYNFIFHRAIRKHGPDNFCWEKVYQTSDEDYSYEIERLLIKEFNTWIKDPLCNGYNMTPGGDGAGSGWSHTEATKNKISISNTGKRRTPEEKKKMSDWQLGTKKGPCKESTKIKISIANKGRPRTEEWCRKISETSKGRSPPNKGQKTPYEIVLKNCKRYLITWPDEHKEEIINLAKFCRENNLSSQHMAAIARGERKSHKGFKTERIY